MVTQTTVSGEDFAALLDESLIAQTDLVGKVLKGTIVNIQGDLVIVDVGLKSEGRIPLQEFGHGAESRLKKLDVVDVYVERMEDRDGMIVLSHEKARREASWKELEEAYQKNQQVMGVIFSRVKGGFTVDLNGAIAFLPGSQLDVRPIKELNSLMNIEQPFMILKMDRSRGNIVVSRRAVLEETRVGARDELLSKIEEGAILEGVVKNITDYGAFIDLGGIDGLLHVTDMSYRRLNYPSDILALGQTVKVQVIRYNRENGRISLGMKQLESDPWEGVESRYKTGQKVKGHVTNIADYGAFVEIEPGIEGLIHVSEMSWTKKNTHPGKLLSSSQEIEAVILEVDMAKRRIALGLKQTMDNPWQKVQTQFPVGTEFEGVIRNITEFGLFVAVTDDIDGMVHMNDLSWEMSGDKALKSYKTGDKIKVKVLEIDLDKERIALGVKQLQSDPLEESFSSIKKNDLVTCEIKEIREEGLEVLVMGSIHGFIRKSDLAKDRTEQRTDRFAVGEKVDAKILNVDRKSRQVQLSVKAREIQEEREVMAAYGSTDSGASLGDILGAALAKKRSADEAAAEAPAKKKSSKKAEAVTEEAAAETEEDVKPKKKATKKSAKDEADA